MDDDQPDGAWLVYGLDYGLDWNAYPIVLFSDELAARRWADDNYGYVVFWPFGLPWDEVKR